MVRLQLRELPGHALDPRLVFLEEDSAAAVVQRAPHRTVVAQAEDQEVAGRLPLENLCRDGDLSEGLLRSDVGGGVVDDGFCERGWKLCARRCFSCC